MERVVFLLEPGGERLGCMLNPESLVVKRSAGVTACPNAGGLVGGDSLADDPLLFTGGGTTEFTFDLLFDVSIEGSSIRTNDVRELTGPLWDLAENKNAVFIVATSNDISGLPPELMRKGRLDEIFFIDLPDHSTRQEIFRIHLEKRGIDAENFDLAALAATAVDFTGAEIEEAIVSARYLADARDDCVTQQDIQAALDRTYPIAVLKAESIDGLRAWAKDRTVPA